MLAFSACFYIFDKNLYKANMAFYPESFIDHFCISFRSKIQFPMNKFEKAFY